MNKKNVAAAANRTALGQRAPDSNANGPGIVDTPATDLTEAVADQPHFSPGVLVKLVTVHYPAGFTDEDKTRFQASLEALFLRRIRKSCGLHTGHTAGEPVAPGGRRRVLEAVQSAYQPELIVGEATGRPVQALLREWLRKGIEVDLLFYEPDATGQSIVYAWYFEGCYPQSTGSDEVGSPSVGPLEYSIYMAGTYNNDLDGAVARAYNLLVAEAQEKQAA